MDEAHQLGDRVREMLSARLPRAAVKAALRESDVPEIVARRFRSIDRALAALAKEAGDDEEREVPRPEALHRALVRFNAAFADAAVDLDPFPAATDARWQLLRLERAFDWSDEGSFRYLATGTHRRFAIEIACTVPSSHIRATMDAFHGTVRLSGTLTPAAVFQRIHGFSADDRCLRSEGCFDPSRLGVFVVPDLSTYYRDRTRTLPQLAELIRNVRGATPGNCLVAFPSFEYLDAVAALGGEHVRRQTPGMEAQEREEFIGWLGERVGERRLGLVVMGGLFAESVDFDSRALRTVIVVGPGLPPRSLRRDLIATDAGGGDGDEIAYRQPAMTRVVQAVGRIARADQRGLAVLVDPRFRATAYRAFLPRHWRIHVVSARSSAGAAERFWSCADSAPPFADDIGEREQRRVC